MKSNRRQAREDAMQILYQLDLNPDLDARGALAHFSKLYKKEGKAIDPYTERLVNGVSDKVKEIDTILKKTSEHWRPDRMAAVDRNILRLGVFELCFCDDVPATVTINEMIEVAKQFGTENSPSFINGILDKVRIQNPIASKAP